MTPEVVKLHFSKRIGWSSFLKQQARNAKGQP